MYMVTNQHQPEDCPELSDELGSYYDAKKPSGNLNVYCTAAPVEHKMFFLVEAAGSVEALQAMPAGFLRSATTVTEVEEAYKYTTAGR